MRSPAPTHRQLAVALTVLSVAVVLAACSGSTRRATPPTNVPTTAVAAGTTAAPTTTAACDPSAVLASWSVERLAAQTIVVPVQETDIASVTSDVAGGAGGVILFGTAAPPDLARQLSALRAAAPGRIAPLVMTDEEGGAVQRMANLVGVVPSAREMGATMTPAQIEQTARGLAVRLRAAGVTMDLAPVLDLDGGRGPDAHDPDGTRSFGTSEPRASADARAFANGLAAGGVVAVAKHFPGLGGASGNTDVMPATTRPWADLRANGLLPFVDAVASHVPAIMVANAVVPGLTTVPAGISRPAITGVLRERLGFNGLVVTDSLSAAALRDIGYSVPRAATAALAAGADMILYDASDATVIAVRTIGAIVNAVHDGEISRAGLERAVWRILAVKQIDLCPAG